MIVLAHPRTLLWGLMLLLPALAVAPESRAQSGDAPRDTAATLDDKARLPLEKIGPAPVFKTPEKAADVSGKPNAQAARHLERARKYFEQQHWSDAMAALEKALEIDPSLVDARILYARAAVRLGNVSAARHQLDEAMDREPRNPAIHRVLGDVFVQQQDGPAAIAAYRAALAARPGADHDPDVVLTHLLLAQVLNEAGYLAAAAGQYDAYLAAISQPTPAMQSHIELREAMDLYRGKAAAMLGDIRASLGEFDAARAAYDRAIRERPHDTELVRRRILTIARSGDAEAAIAEARDWARASGRQGASLELLREVCEAAGKPELFDKELVRLGEASAGQDNVVSMARMLAQRGKTREAIDLLTTASKDPRPDLEALYLLAELAAGTGEIDRAFDALHAALTASPGSMSRAVGIASAPATADAFLRVAESRRAAASKDAVLRILLGSLLTAAGRHDEAVAALSEDPIDGPQAGNAAAVLAQSYVALKRWDDAIAAVREARDAGVKSYGLLLALGDAKAALGDDVEAEKAYLDAFELDRASGEPLFRMGLLAERRGESRRYEELLKRVLDDVEPRHVKAREKIVVLYLNRGEIEKCREYFSDFESLVISGPPVERCRAMLALTKSTAPTPAERLDEYLAALHKILETHPNDWETHLEIARSHAAVNDFDKALAAADRALAIAPNDLGGRELRANLLMKLLRFEEAARQVRGMLRDRPRDLAYMQDLLRIADSSGDWATAADLLKEFLAREDLKDQWPAFTAMRVSALTHAEKWDEAIQVAKAWLDASPGDIVRRSTYLATLGHAGRHDEAVAQAESYLADDPQNRLLQIELLRRLQDARRYNEAIQHTLSWLADAADDVDLNMALVRLCWSARRWDEAIEISRTNAERSESRTTFEELLGESYRHARRFDEAEELYKDRIAKAERRRRQLETELRQGVERKREGAVLIELREAIAAARLANYSLINVLLAAERYDQAERAVNKLLKPELDARDAGDNYDQALVIDMRNILSEIYSDTDRISQAIQQLEAIYELDPQDAGVNNNLGYSLADHGLELDRAERMIRYSLSQNPKSHASLDSLGWALYKRGKFDEAVFYIRQALRQTDSEEPTLHDHLGDALYRRGDAEAAVAEWREAMKMCAPDHDPPPDHDRRVLYKKLKAKIAAYEAGRTVTTASIGERPAPATQPGR